MDALILELCLLCGFTLIVVVLLLRSYLGKSYVQAPWLLYCLIVGAFFLNFAPVSFLLYDISVAVSTHGTNHVIFILWAIVYVTVQLLSWLVLPISKSYLEVGNFTSGARLRAAVAFNAKLYGSMAVLCLALLAWVLISQGVTSLESFMGIVGIGRAASNGFGLFLTAVLMGYGMVQMPRSWFLTVNVGKYKDWHEREAVRLWSDADDSQIDWIDIQDVATHVDREITTDNPLRFHVDYINGLVDQVNEDIKLSCPHLFVRGQRLGRRASALATSRPDKELNEKLLVELHARIRATAHKLLKTEYLWTQHCLRYCLLEEVRVSLRVTELKCVA